MNNKNHIIKKDDIIQKISWFWISRKHAKLLLCHELNLKQEDFFVNNEFVITQKQLLQLSKQAKKVHFWYPIEYALHSAEFYGYNFYVDENCLIPRDDTEIMVDTARNVLQTMWDKIVYIDVWTGSGAIPISLYLELQLLESTVDFFAIDICPKALFLAKKMLKYIILNDLLDS